MPNMQTRPSIVRLVNNMDEWKHWREDIISFDFRSNTNFNRGEKEDEENWNCCNEHSLGKHDCGLFLSFSWCKKWNQNIICIEGEVSQIEQWNVGDRVVDCEWRIKQCPVKEFRNTVCNPIWNSNWYEEKRTKERCKGKSVVSLPPCKLPHGPWTRTEQTTLHHHHQVAIRSNEQLDRR